jgi:ubiquitin-like domain-containing CTD phosphatase 1
MKWIEEKMKLLGCDRHPDYKLAFYLDSRAMISIHSPRYGVIEVRIQLIDIATNIVLI